MDIEQITYMQNLLNSPIACYSPVKPGREEKRFIKKKMRAACPDTHEEIDLDEIIKQAKSHINKEIKFKVFVANIVNNVCVAMFMESDYKSKKIIKQLYQAYAPEFSHAISDKFTFLIPRTRTVYYDSHAMPCIADRCVNQICEIRMKPGIFKTQEKNSMRLNVYRIQLT